MTDLRKRIVCKIHQDSDILLSVYAMALKEDRQEVIESALQFAWNPIVQELSRRAALKAFANQGIDCPEDDILEKVIQEGKEDTEKFLRELIRFERDQAGLPAGISKAE